MTEYFGDRVDNFSIYNLTDTPHEMFSIDFQAYKYFIITLGYDRGSFGCAINYGKSNISLENSQKWFDEVYPLDCKLKNYLLDPQSILSLLS